MLFDSWLRRDLLKRKMAADCGPADELPGLGAPQFGEWLRQGPYASAAHRDRVVPQLTAYLLRAERIGIRWGLRRGVVAGLLLSAVVAAGWLVAEVLT